MLSALKMASVVSVFLLQAISPNKWAETEQIYYLPFQEDFKSLCAQGNYGIISHQELEKAAVDFLMPVGTKVLASRGGEVVKVITSNKKRCPDTSACPNNEIVVKHDDDTYARYVHLKYDENPQVKVGQSVERGQLLAYSGNVGNSALPHVHFEVYYFDENGKQQFLITRFVEARSNKGIPQANFFYTSGNKPSGTAGDLE
jgi:murein DD-endopeptidase MepM/ murein hydrolase activator NlpD